MSKHPGTPAQSALPQQTPACSVAIRHAEQAFLLLPQPRAPAPVDTLRTRDWGAGSGFYVKASGNACAVALPQQTPACSVAIRHAEQAFLLLPQPRAPAPVDTLRTRDWGAGSGFYVKASGNACAVALPQQTPACSVAIRHAGAGLSAAASPGRRPRSTRYGRETGALALILCQSIRERLRSRLAAADPCLLGGNPACGAGLFAAATAPGAGPRSTRYGRETGALALDFMSKHPGTPAQSPCRSRPLLARWQSGMRSRPFCCCKPRAPAPGRHATDARLGALALDFMSKHPGTPAQSPCRSRPLLARWQSGMRSRPFCCCHRPQRRPQSTRCGRVTGRRF